MLYPNTIVTIIVIFLAILVAAAIMLNAPKNKRGSQFRNNKPLPKNPARVIRTTLQKAEKHPHNPQALQKLAYSYFDLGEWRKAQQIFKNLLTLSDISKINADVSVLLQKYGIASMHVNMYQQAFTALRDSHRLNPKSFDTSYYLGYVEYKRKNYANATRHLKNALILSPGHKKASEILGLALAKTKHYREAKPILEKCIGDNNPEVMFFYAECLKNSGSTARAKEFYKRLVKSPYLTAKAAYELGNIAVQERNIDMGIQYYEQVLYSEKVTNESLMGAHLALANIYAKQQEHDKEKHHIEAIQHIDPNNREANERIEQFKNKPLYTYLNGSDKASYNVCKRILINIFHRTPHKILSCKYKNKRIDMVVEVRNPTTQALSRHLILFIRTLLDTPDEVVRSLAALLQETSSTSAYCLTPGHFTENAISYAKNRSIILIDKQKFIPMLKKML